MRASDPELLQALAGASRSHDVDEAIGHVCAALSSDPDVTALGLYWLRHSVGSFEPYFAYGDAESLPRRLLVAGPRERQEPGPGGVQRTYRMEYAPEFPSLEAEAFYASPTKAEASFETLALIGYCKSATAAEDFLKTLSIVAQSLTLLFERRRTFELLDKLQSPLDYSLRRHDFVPQLMEIVESTRRDVMSQWLRLLRSAEADTSQDAGRLFAIAVAQSELGWKKMAQQTLGLIEPSGDPGFDASVEWMRFVVEPTTENRGRVVASFEATGTQGTNREESAGGSTGTTSP